MADELDLETGDEKAADALSERQKRRRERRAETTGTTPKPRAQAKDENDLLVRLTAAFIKLADQFDAREDEELATAVREESQPMAVGLMSLTKHIAPLRVVLVLLVDLLEPVLAFWRVGRILVYRMVMRRQARWDEANNGDVAPTGDFYVDVQTQ